MKWAFDVTALVAVIATILVVTSTNAIHALLCLILSLLSAAVLLFILGAPLAAGLEVIIYAGAIMVMFVFVVMLLEGGKVSPREEARNMRLQLWALPMLLALTLFGEIVYVIFMAGGGYSMSASIDPVSLGATIFGPYLIAVEAAALLLLAGLLGAIHLGRSLHGGRGHE